MVEKSQFKNPEQKKTARIEYLENLAKWHLYSLEMLASLGELHHSASQNGSPDKIFQIANEHLLKIIEFDAVAFYLVDEPDADFILKYGSPEDTQPSLQKEVNRRIDDGSFAWAVNQNRPVMVKSTDGNQNLILHVLSTKRRVRGMFAGLIQAAAPRLEETIQYTLSIILQNTANALESMALYNLFQETNAHLESKIRERTTNLEDHMVKMKEEIAHRKLAEESLWVARQEVESALKAKTDLLTQFNYELKTPINSILDYGEMIRSEIEKLGETSLLESFKNMQTTGRHLLKLIQGMQSSAQTNWQALGPQAQTFKVKEVLEGILVTLFPMARKNNNKMELKQGPDLGSMVSDELRVRQILLNIIVNACQFTENGKILIETMVENVAGEEWICFRISDTGAGMDPEKARNLFREGSAIQPQSIPFGGTGMGLPFSKRLCAMLGGNIQVKSEVNKGSVFSVRLPRDIQSFIAKQRRNPITPEVKTPTSTYQVLPGSIEEEDPSLKISGSAEVDADESLKKKEICVVDENFDNSNILCHILKGQGWSARPLELSKSTLDKLDREIPDMIIICLGVAGDQGLQLISELGKRESMKSIPILIFSARELGDDEKSLLEGRVQGMMHRGNCTRQELIDQIKSLLRNESSK